MFVLDYSNRTSIECLIDGITLMAETITDSRYVATGDALDWAENARNDATKALSECGDDALLWLSELWDNGAQCLYSVTGLHAFEDGCAGGLFFLTDDEMTGASA